MLNNRISELNHCLACGGLKLKEVMSLGYQALANAYRESDTIQDKYPLAINRCLNCAHVQLSSIVDPKIIYENYAYVSGTSTTMRKHFDWFASYAQEKLFDYRRAPWKEVKVLDIGCNDASQLDAFKRMDDPRLKTYGVDPAANIFPISSIKGHDIVCSNFDSKYVEKNHRYYDIIVAQNVFAHNPYPAEFLKNAHKILAPDGLLFIQTSQCDMIKNAEYDTIYHEHISFFNIHSMKVLVNNCGMGLIDVIKCPLHGNSYIFVISAHKDFEQRYKHHVENLLSMESFLHKDETYTKYRDECISHAEEVRKITYQYKDKTIPVIGYGAAAKGNTMIGASGMHLDCMIDDNDMKQGKYLPGRSIFICNSKMLEFYQRPILIVPMAWNFFDEIVDKVKSIRGNKYKDHYLRVNPFIEITEE